MTIKSYNGEIGSEPKLKLKQQLIKVFNSGNLCVSRDFRINIIEESDTQMTVVLNHLNELSREFKLQNKIDIIGFVALCYTEISNTIIMDASAIKTMLGEKLIEKFPNNLMSFSVINSIGNDTIKLPNNFKIDIIATGSPPTSITVGLSRFNDLDFWVSGNFNFWVSGNFKLRNSMDINGFVNYCAEIINKDRANEKNIP